MSLEETLTRRSLLHFGLGRSGPVDDTGPVQTMQVQMSVGETRDATPVIQHFGFSSHPPVGSAPVFHAQQGDRAKLVVTGSIHAASRPRNLLPGQSAVFDLSGTLLKLTSDGNGSLVLSSATGTFALSGNLAVTGSITATGSIVSAVDVLGGPASISLVHHVHPAPGGTTGAPEG